MTRVNDANIFSELIKNMTPSLWYNTLFLYEYISGIKIKLHKSMYAVQSCGINKTPVVHILQRALLIRGSVSRRDRRE